MPLYSPGAQASLPLKKKKRKNQQHLFLKDAWFIVYYGMKAGVFFFFFLTNLKPRHQFMQAFYMNAIRFIHQEGG